RSDAPAGAHVRSGSVTGPRGSLPFSRCTEARPAPRLLPLNAAVLEGVAVGADLVAPELALEAPVVEVGRGHRRSVDGLACEVGLLIDSLHGQLLFGVGDLEADDVGLIAEGLDVALGLGEPVAGEGPGDLHQHLAVA